MESTNKKPFESDVYLLEGGAPLPQDPKEFFGLHRLNERTELLKSMEPIEKDILDPILEFFRSKSLSIPDVGYRDKTPDNTDLQGFFSPYHQVAMVSSKAKRQEILCSNSGNLEDINFSDYIRASIEGVLVHELAHGSRASEFYFDWDEEESDLNVLFFGKSGLIDYTNNTKKHIFWEEGFAELIAAMYRKEKNSLNEEAKKNSSCIEDDFYLPKDLPSNYLTYYSSSSLINYSMSVLPAYALEKLCTEISGLFEAIINSRSDVNEINAVHETINKRFPNLLESLEDLQYTQSGFSSGYKTVSELISRTSPTVSLPARSSSEGTP